MGRVPSVGDGVERSSPNPYKYTRIIVPEKLRSWVEETFLMCPPSVFRNYSFEHWGMLDDQDLLQRHFAALSGKR